jgi:hypothetical protein
VTARRIVLAAYWALVVTLAALASMAAAIPFTGGTASAAGIVAAAAVLIAGLACEPHRKDHP